MKRFITKIVAALVLMLASCSVSSLAQQEPQYDMGIMQMLFLSRFSAWKGEERDLDRIKKEQRAQVESLVREGKLALCGEVADDDGLREIMVFRTESIDEARQMAQALPAVRAGMLTADTISWYTARNLIKTPQLPVTQSDYIFGLLVRGPKWTKEQTEETKKIQEGHMANINRLGKTGKLVLAGPFEGNEDRRGVFIFKVATTAEAQALTDTDPAVVAGRLKIKLYRWSVAKGMLP
ncbi:MAG: YciI family protein [Pyrinomonadaceae bacterium]